MDMNEWLARTAVAVARGVRRVLLGELSGTLPQRNVRMLEHAMHEDYVRRHVADIRHVEEPFEKEYPFPDDYPSYFLRSKSFDRRVEYALTDVCVSPRTGFVWLPEGYAVQESVGSLNRVLSWGDVLHEPLLPVRSLDIDAPIIPCPADGTSFYHWLLESLPNVLHVLRSVPDSVVLLFADSPSYVEASFREALGDETFERRTYTARRPVRARNVALRGFRAYSGFVDPRDVEILQETYAHCRNDSSTGPKNLYVSRSQTANRPLRRERELEAALDERGYEIIHAEDHAFQEQIRLFASAERVIAPHGAGLSHVIWMGASARVLEVLPHESVNDCFARLSLQAGLEYDYVRCRPHPDFFGEIPVSDVVEKAERLEKTKRT